MSTVMTVAALAQAGRLIEFEKEDDDHRQPERCLYFRPETKQWIDQLSIEKDPFLDAEQPKRARDALSPAEQAFRVFDRFVYDKDFYLGDIPRMMPVKHGVQAMHTDSLRLIGAFHQPNVFICAAADFKRNLKGNGAVAAAHMKAVRDFFRTLPLREPKISLRDQRELLGKTIVAAR
jgi:hypothetical protein